MPQIKSAGQRQNIMFPKISDLFTIPELKIRYDPKLPASDRPKIKSSEDAFHLVYPLFMDYLKHREAFMVIYMNRANRVLGVHQTSIGGLSGTVADPKVIYQSALLTNSSSLILVHNHPSDATKPSQNDIDLTKKIKSAGKLLDIDCLDHLILGWDSYYSFADEGLI